MIGWERRVLLRHYLEQGMTKRELAERFGISRQTIYRWIRSGELDRDLSAAGVHYSARAPVATKLDRYRDILVSRLGEYPDLTAVRLFEEIKAAGYAGGYTQVKEYVRKVRPRAPEEPVVRFETPPGHQGQVDFADFRLPGASGMRFWLFLASPACCGCSSSHDRRCCMCSRAWRRPSPSLVVCLVSCCSTR